MSRVLPATCENGVVKVGDLVIDDAIILGAGVASSEGILVLEGDDPPYYLVSNALDLKTTLENISSVIADVAAAITKIATSLTSICAGMTGPTTAPPPTLPADVVDLTAKVTSLNATKAQVDQLKDALT